MSHEQQNDLLSPAARGTDVAFRRGAGPVLDRFAVATRRGHGVAQLCDALDAAFEAGGGAADPSHYPAFVRGVRAALAEAAANETLLAPAQCEGSSECYRRHLLAADAAGRYAVVALVWHPGQASPVHGHHAWCGYAVLSGTLTETLYQWDESLGSAKPLRTHARVPGAVSYTRAGLGGIHRLGNAGPARAISLHVYGVAGDEVSTHVNDVVRVSHR
jgi:predicted metal-dependent enzyme (double-stranded beta helix superfamily)